MQAGVEGDSLEGDAESAPGPSAPEPNGEIWKLALGTLGIVFGDIGASPLYAFRESFVGHHRLPLDGFHVISVLSLLIRALILVVTPLG